MRNEIFAIVNARKFFTVKCVFRDLQYPRADVILTSSNFKLRLPLRLGFHFYTVRFSGRQMLLRYAIKTVRAVNPLILSADLILASQRLEMQRGRSFWQLWTFSSWSKSTVTSEVSVNIFRCRKYIRPFGTLSEISKSKVCVTYDTYIR